MRYPVLEEPLPLRLPDDIRVPDTLVAALDTAWDTAEEKVRALVRSRPGEFPLYTLEGRWAPSAEAWTNWCEGFLVGLLWLLAEHTGDPWLRGEAERYSLMIEARKRDTEVHDLGFLLWSSWRRWFELTGDPVKDAVVVEAGHTLAMRFQERGRYLRSFLASNSVFIDIMMNVGIIFYAAARSQDRELARRAYDHCLTTQRVLLWGDGSASHEGIFDPDSGQFLRPSTQQGWRDDGSWARGQSWALYGYGTAYRFTADRRFLATAVSCADFYIERTGDDRVSPNDWEDPDPDPRWESSAAAVVAGGLWQLAGIVPDSARARYYADYALRILDRLCDPEFLTSEDPDWEGIIKHDSYHINKGLGVDESVMWGTISSSRVSNASPITYRPRSREESAVPARNRRAPTLSSTRPLAESAQL
jgi:unsaturated chondroitin disaccharide hydrolase